MTLVQKLLLGGVPTVAAGGTGAWVMISRSSRGENGSLDGGNLQGATVVSGIKVGDDAKQTSEPEDLIRQAGLNCGDGKTAGKECSIGSTGLNVDRDGKKVGLFPVEGENGNIKFWLSDDSTYTNKFRFTITGKPIKLKNKDKTSETITLEKYENYGLVKDESANNKVYLTRKLTADQGKIKSLGLPDTITLPTTIETTVTSKELSLEQIKLVNFDGKQDGGATTIDKVNLKVYKVNDTTTFPGGYKFSFQPHQDVTIAADNKLARDVWKDFRIKDPTADDLVLEKVWKSEDELLKEVGLECKGDSNTCTIKDGSLKIKVGDSSMKDGKKKTEGSTGTLYLEKNRSGHYEGLRFEVWGGGITIESSSSSQTTLKMEETEIFHISKEDKNDSSYYLARKHDVKEMILYHLGLNNNSCSLPDGNDPKTCTIPSSDLNKIKFYEGGGEKTITGSGSLSVTITIATADKTTYPFGYKFTLQPSGEMKVGESITLSSSSQTEFKIRKDVDKKKLYLEKV